MLSFDWIEIGVWLLWTFGLRFALSRICVFLVSREVLLQRRAVLQLAVRCVGAEMSGGVTANNFLLQRWAVLLWAVRRENGRCCYGR